MDRAWWLGAGRDELGVLERDLSPAYPQLRRTADLARGWLIYEQHVTVTHYSVAHEVAVVLYARPSEREPLVYATNTQGFRHLYEHGRLCLWHPKDAPDRRWTLDDGLVRLLDLVAVQLFKEHYFREHGEWLGGTDAEVHADAKPDLAARERIADAVRHRS